jgi:hypothetical protein
MKNQEDFLALQQKLPKEKPKKKSSLSINFSEVSWEVEGMRVYI